MKRLLQGLALLQVFLVVAIGARIVSVWTTPLPQVGEIPELPATTSVPPAKPAPRISGAVTDGIVAHDLFDDERGQGEPIEIDGPTVDEAPVPPPSTVKLMGVMILGEEPVGILLDTNVNPEQQAVRKGDMFGEYQVGDISPSGLLLIGSQSQQFQIALRVEAAATASAGPPPPPAPRTPGTAGRPAPASKAAAARPAPAARGVDAEQKAMSARERAQAIAQRNAELRRAQKPGAEGEQDGTDAPATDPVQARLEALRQLREAAKSR